LIRSHFKFSLCASVAMAAIFCACSRPVFDTERDIQEKRATAADAIESATAALSKAVEARDVEKCVSFYADDAVLFVPKAPYTMGKDNIRKVWQQLLASPGLQLNVLSSGEDVAGSADLAWQHGSFEVITTDAKGKTTTEAGKLVIIWKKQPDSSWKIVADTNADDK
jgi:uncharacterized protein (TIGR02246 family)